MIRSDFVSNSSSSSFIFDIESWDKATEGKTYNMLSSTFNLYDICDNENNIYLLDIELGPWDLWNDEPLKEFKILPDTEWIQSFMIGDVDGFILPESLKHYADSFIEAFKLYKSRVDLNSGYIYKEAKYPYITEVISKLIKPNIPNIRLIEFTGDDHMQLDMNYENEEDKVRQICRHVKSNYPVKFYHEDTSH